MGKKSEKAKERKGRREEDAKTANRHWKKVEKANEVEDPLESFVSFKTYSKNELNAKISCVRRTDMSDEDMKLVFDLTKTNMQAIYESSWGWNDKTKRRELDEDRMWFLMARDGSSGKLLAFVSFRFDIDYEEPVVYCYEIQLSLEVQRKGLGKFLMQVLQLFAIKFRMHKVVSTVLHKNEASMKFFREKLGYVTDKSNPYEECYDILCKNIPRRKGGDTED